MNLKAIARQQRAEVEKELAECKIALAAAERDLAENWDREMIHEPAQREKERRAKIRAKCERLKVKPPFKV